MLSPAKYPVEGSLQEYNPLYAKIPRERLKHGHFHLSDVKHSLDVEASQKKFLLSSESFLLQELQKRRQVEHLDGLGRLPDRLPSVSSLLLFNTSENPYKTYLSLDNLEGKAPAEREAEKQALAAAPKTVAEGDELPEASRLQFGYKPQLGEVPEFVLPNNLDLPNVADIVYADSSESAQAIAPSATLPEFDANGNVVTTMPAYQAPAQPKTAAPVAAATPAPVQSQAAPVPAQPTVAPPQPRPTAAAQPAQSDSEDEDDGGGGGGGRGDLLAAIRKGKKLKKVDADEDGTPREEKKPPPKAAGGDLFSDLLSVLTRRRQGIGNRADKMDGPSSSKLNIPSLPEEDDAQSEDDGAWD